MSISQWLHLVNSVLTNLIQVGWAKFIYFSLISELWWIISRVLVVKGELTAQASQNWAYTYLITVPSTFHSQIFSWERGNTSSPQDLHVSVHRSFGVGRYLKTRHISNSHPSGGWTTHLNISKEWSMAQRQGWPTTDTWERTPNTQC